MNKKCRIVNDPPLTKKNPLFYHYGMKHEISEQALVSSIQSHTIQSCRVQLWLYEPPEKYGKSMKVYLMTTTTTTTNEKEKEKKKMTQYISTHLTERHKMDPDCPITIIKADEEKSVEMMEKSVIPFIKYNTYGFTCSPHFNLIPIPDTFKIISITPKTNIELFHQTMMECRSQFFKAAIYPEWSQLMSSLQAESIKIYAVMSIPNVYSLYIFEIAEQEKKVTCRGSINVGALSMDLFVTGFIQCWSMAMNRKNGELFIDDIGHNMVIVSELRRLWKLNNVCPKACFLYNLICLPVEREYCLVF